MTEMDEMTVGTGKPGEDRGEECGEDCGEDCGERRV